MCIRHRSRPSEFHELGIGIELDLHQLLSLAIVFLFMGLVTLGSLFGNVSQYFEARGAAGESSASSLIQALRNGLIIGTTLGSRTEPFDLSSAGQAEAGATVVFIIYLLWLRIFNVRRAKATQEACITAADWTVEVRGIKKLKDATGQPLLRTAEDVALYVADAVQLLSLIHI